MGWNHLTRDKTLWYAVEITAMQLQFSQETVRYIYIYMVQQDTQCGLNE